MSVRGFRLSFNAWIWRLSSISWFISSKYHPSFLLNFFTGLTHPKEIHFPLSLIGSSVLEMDEMVCWSALVMMSSEVRWIKWSSGSSPGFLMGEFSSTRTILGVGIRGGMDWVAQKASTVSLVFILEISRLRLKVSARLDGQQTEDHLFFSSSERILVMEGFSLMAWRPRFALLTRSFSSN